MSKIKTDSILITTFIIGILTLIVFLIAYQKNKHLLGLEITKNLILKTLPLILITFLFIGLIQAIVPQNLISSWIGKLSGVKGILIGSAIGMIFPGGPYIFLPILAGIYKIGGKESIPVIVSIYTAKFLIGINRLPFELGILGPKFTFIRIGATLLLAPLSGLISKGIMEMVK
ncbi:permease [bacterium]|nr:permease [bacterium]